MWMTDNHSFPDQFKLHDRAKLLRPLIPRPFQTGPEPKIPNYWSLQNPNFNQWNNHLSTSPTSDYRIQRDIAPPPVIVTSRWNPTPEQLQSLEEMYRRGIRTPSAEQIQQIAGKLRRFGKIEGKNVFYWFQNHKARERQRKRRQELEMLAGKKMRHVQTVPSNPKHQQLGLGSSSRSRKKRELEIGEAKKVPTTLLLPPSNPTALQQYSASMVINEEEEEVDNEELQEQTRGAAIAAEESSVKTWQQLDLSSCLSPNNTSLDIVDLSGGQEISKAFSLGKLGLHHQTHPHPQHDEINEGFGNGETCEIITSKIGVKENVNHYHHHHQTLDLFPVKGSCLDLGIQQHTCDVNNMGLTKLGPNHHFYEFLPVKEGLGLN